MKEAYESIFWCVGLCYFWTLSWALLVLTSGLIFTYTRLPFYSCDSGLSDWRPQIILDYFWLYEPNYFTLPLVVKWYHFWIVRFICHFHLFMKIDPSSSETLVLVFFDLVLLHISGHECHWPKFIHILNGRVGWEPKWHFAN